MLSHAHSSDPQQNGAADGSGSGDPTDSANASSATSGAAAAASQPAAPPVVKERKKHDRFNGMPEEEVAKRTLPDHLTEHLDIVIVSLLCNRHTTDRLSPPPPPPPTTNVSFILIQNCSHTHTHRSASIRGCSPPTRATTTPVRATTSGSVCTWPR